MPEFAMGPRKKVMPGTQNPFTKDALDMTSAPPMAPPRKAMRDGTSQDSSGSYKQKGVPAGAMGNAIESLIQRKDPE